MADGTFTCRFRQIYRLKNLNISSITAENVALLRRYKLFCWLQTIDIPFHIHWIPHSCFEWHQVTAAALLSTKRITTNPRRFPAKRRNNTNSFRFQFTHFITDTGGTLYLCSNLLECAVNSWILSLAYCSFYTPVKSMRSHSKTEPALNNSVHGKVSQSVLFINKISSGIVVFTSSTLFII